MSLSLRVLAVAALCAVVLGTRLGHSHKAPGNASDEHFDPEVGLSVKLTGAPQLSPGQSWQTLSPSDDLQSLVEKAPAGQAFRLTAGVYRLQQVTPKDGDIFYGEPGAVLNGSRLLTEFSHEGSVWMARGLTQQRGEQSGYCLKGHAACSLPEDLFFDDTLVQRVTSRAEVRPGRWYYDYANQRAILGDDPSGHRVELGQSRYGFAGSAVNVTVRGLVIEKYAAPSQHGAIEMTGPGWSVEENEVRFVHGAGVSGSARATVRGNSLHHNGQQGLHFGGGDGIVVENNTIAYNNTAGFDSGWEAGGAKFASTEDLTVRGNIVVGNRGPGLWADVSNNKTLYTANRVEDNDGPGIYHEISYRAEISNNTIRRNGIAYDPWLWGGQIVISNSPDIEISGNTVEVSDKGGDGITVIQSSDRGTGKYGPHVTANVSVHDNMIKYLGSVGSTGADADINADRFFAANIRFDRNTYIVSDEKAKLWEWRGAQDWQGMRAAGQEASGRIETP